MQDRVAFLSTSPVFRGVPAGELERIAALFEERRYPAGAKILEQGGRSQAVYFLRSGRCAVRVERADSRETVAYLQPPDLFGELSFVTGKTCSADVEVVVDAEVLVLTKEASVRLPQNRETILRGLLEVIADRMHSTVTGGAKAKVSPVVVLENQPHWEAPYAFGSLLALSLAEQSGEAALCVNLAETGDGAERLLSPQSYAVDLGLRGSEGEMREELARRLTEWKARFPFVILNPMPSAPAVREVAAALAQANAPDVMRGWLAGPGDALPADTGSGRFVAQSGEAPTLPVLDGGRQLIFDAAESETAFRAGRPVPARFRRSVDSLARHILGTQVGIALGGGAAWGWAHIGVLSVFEKAGLPIDVIAGCSMGSVIGALRAAGISVPDLQEIADYWKTRTRRFIEWRFWRMCLLNEAIVLKTFERYWGARTVNQLEIPYWANAVDIKTGKEFTIRDGPVTHCVRASIALPGLMPPFKRDDVLLVDSGIMNPVPVRLVRRMGARFIVAINAMAAMEEQEISSRYPFNAFDLMFRCTRIMGHEIGQARAEDAANFVLTPDYGNITMLQFARAPEIIECGRRVAEMNLPVILEGYQRVKAGAAVERRQPAERR